MKFKNQNIVITGASHGLGRALANILGKKGANLYLLSRTINQIDFPFKAQKISCDLRSLEQIRDTLAKIPKIDVLINCVGVPLVKKLGDSKDEEIINVIQTNLTGIIIFCKYSIPKLLKSKNSFIINVISTSGKKPREKETVYCASKWGLSGFTKSLWLELNTYKIKVIGVYPGGMNSWHFWKGIKTKEEVKKYLDVNEVAMQIVNLLSSKNSAPTELVIERLP